MAPGLVNAPEWTVFAAAPLVLIGHNLPVFLRFRGGKGAAVLLGVSVGLFPIVTAFCLISIALVMMLFRNVVLGAAAGYVLVCLTLIVVGTEWPMVALSVFPGRTSRSDVPLWIPQGNLRDGSDWKVAKTDVIPLHRIVMGDIRRNRPSGIYFHTMPHRAFLEFRRKQLFNGDYQDQRMLR